MKHGKKTTKRQKEFLKKCRLNPDNWLIIKDCSECFEIVNRLTEKTRRMERNDKV